MLVKRLIAEMAGSLFSIGGKELPIKAVAHSILIQ